MNLSDWEPLITGYLQLKTFKHPRMTLHRSSVTESKHLVIHYHMIYDISIPLTHNIPSLKTLREKKIRTYAPPQVMKNDALLLGRNNILVLIWKLTVTITKY